MRKIILLTIVLFLLFALVTKLTTPQSTNQKASQKDVDVSEEPKYSDELECWLNDDWQKISGCSELRGQTYLALAEIEKKVNKLNLKQPSTEENYPSTFISEKFNFQISYPETWSLTKQNYEGIETIKINNSSSKNTEPTELIIGTGQAYSTSGALCANQGCDYEGGKVIFANGFETVLTKSYIWINNQKGIPVGTKVENYRFALPLENLLSKIDRDNYLYVTASFPDEDGGNEILNILTTLK